MDSSTTGIHFSRFCSLEVQDQGAAGSVSDEGAFWLRPHVRGRGESAPIHEDTNPTPKGSPSGLSHLLNAPSLHTITLGIRFPHRNLG